MKLLSDGTYQINNAKTGQTKIVKPEELSQYGLSPQSATPEAAVRQAPVQAAPVQSQNVVSQVDPEMAVRKSPVAPVEQPNFLDKVNNGIAGFAKGAVQAFAKPAQMVGTALGNLAGNDLVTGGNKAMSDQADLITQHAVAAAKSGDKVKADQLFQQASQLHQKASTGFDTQEAKIAADAGGQLSGNMLADIPTMMQGNYAKGVVGTAGEILAPGAGSSIGAGAALGAASGYSDSQKGQELQGALKGAELGGAIATGGQLVGKIAGKLAKPAAQVAEEGTAAQGNILQKAGKALQEDVAPIRVKPSVYGAGKEAAIKDTLVKNGITGNATEQYAKLQPVLSDLGDQIDSALTANPKMISRIDIAKDFENNLRATMRSGNIDKKAAKNMADSYISDVFDEVHNGPMSDKISTKDLFDLKLKVNEDYQSVAKKIESGATLTPQEQVISQARQTLDDTIAKAHPDVKQLTVQQSHLYDAAPALARARDTVPTMRLPTGASLPKVLTAPIQSAEDATGRGLVAMGDAAANVGQKIAPAAGVVQQVATDPLLRGASIGAANSMTGQPLVQPDASGNGEDQNVVPQTQQYGNGNDQNQQVHGGIVSPGVNTQITPTGDVSETPGKSTLNPYGANPEVIYREYQNALQAGDKSTAANLRTMYADEVKYQTANNPNNKLTASAAKDLGDISSSHQLVGEMNGYIQQFKDKMGPLKGIANAVNPYDTDSQAFNAQMSMVAQAVGKSLEGGKMTDKDVPKYEKMLPKMTDTPEVAQRKIQNVQKMLADRHATLKQYYKQAIPDTIGLPAVGQDDFSQPQLGDIGQDGVGG